MITFEVAIMVIVFQLLPAIVMATDFYTFNQLMCIYIIIELVTRLFGCGRKFRHKEVLLRAEISSQGGFVAGGNFVTRGFRCGRKFRHKGVWLLAEISSQGGLVTGTKLGTREFGYWHKFRHKGVWLLAQI